MAFISFIKELFNPGNSLIELFEKTDRIYKAYPRRVILVETYLGDMCLGYAWNLGENTDVFLYNKYFVINAFVGKFGVPCLGGSAYGYSPKSYRDHIDQSIEVKFDGK